MKHLSLFSMKNTAAVVLLFLILNVVRGQRVSFGGNDNDECDDECGVNRRQGNNSPVCGQDGNTYRNQCLARCRNQVCSTLKLRTKNHAPFFATHFNNDWITAGSNFKCLYFHCIKNVKHMVYKAISVLTLCGISN